jgi:serine/threonine-protein kinase RsbW
MGRYRLTIPGNLDRIQEVTCLVGQAARESGFDARTAYACELAVAEACENIVLHGYQAEGRGDIRVAVESAPNSLTIDLEDSAPAFNPAQAPEPKEWTTDNPPVGGLGLIIIHRVMDQVTYWRQGQHNRLRLAKTIHDSAHG